MDSTAIDRQQRARELFFSGAALPTDLALKGVDPAVLRGWQRCCEYGLEPDRPVVLRAVQPSRVRVGRENNHLLRAAAVHELTQLARTLVASGATVMLSDPQLMILDVLGRSDRMSREMRSLAREGVDLSERGVGSSALSLAAFERLPAIVLNNAHFFDANSVFACAAAPLMSPTGALLGILNVATCHDALPADAPFLVTVAAKAIENGLFWQDTKHLLIRFHPREDLVDTALSAFIACTIDGQIVGANQVALAMLNLRWPLDGVRFERRFRQRVGDLLAQAGRLDRFALDLTTQAGAAMFARVRMPERKQLPASRQRSGVSANAHASGSAKAASSSMQTPTSERPASPDWPPASWLPQIVERQALPACLAGVPVLLVGESGVGKSLAASWLARRSKPDGVDRDGANAVAIPLRWRAAHCVPSSPPDWQSFTQALLQGRCLVIEGIDQVAFSLRQPLIDWLDFVQPVLESAVSGRVVATATSLAGIAQFPKLLNRINGLTVDLPPLRRRDDRLTLIEDGLYVASLRAARASEVAPSLDAFARARLAAHLWPGNLHELGWVCRYLAAITTARQPLGIADLPAQLIGTPADSMWMPHGAASAEQNGAALMASALDASACFVEPLAREVMPVQPQRLRDLEQRVVEQTLIKHQGNLSSAARELGVSRGTLYRRIRAAG